MSVLVFTAEPKQDNLVYMKCAKQPVRMTREFGMTFLNSELVCINHNEIDSVKC